MGRGPVVEKKKNASNAAKQKVFSLHAKLISLAAQKWWDANLNPALFDAIEKAKADNVPNENIERAIKKWTWEDKDWVQILNIVYEWYWVWGVAVMVSTLTDNKNRTAWNMRHIFTKYGWNMWEPGSVGFIFDKKWLIEIDLEKFNKDEIENLVFETDVEDFSFEENIARIITSVEDFENVRSFFKSKNYEFVTDKIDFIPNTTAEVTEFDKALKLTKMFEAFHEDEDVESVSLNMIIDDKLQQEVYEFIEKNTFRT